MKRLFAVMLLILGAVALASCTTDGARATATSGPTTSAAEGGATASVPESAPSGPTAQPEYNAPPMEDISPPDSNQKAIDSVAFYEFSDNLPGGFKMAQPLLDMHGAIYDSEHLTIVVEAGEMFKEQDDTYYYSATVNVMGIDFVGGLETPSFYINFERSESHAMVIAAAENGYTQGLADFLRDLMANAGESVETARAWAESFSIR
ncbi:hypothetical protein FWG76_02025 [Candidatus Saccharibacteria bacterium]|nr:hypothetical protein [Candidatus Saccharibacteria bacterium]